MKKRIEFASTYRVVEYQEAMNDLLRHIAAMMKDPETTDDDWLKYCFVSDESSLGHFFLEDELAELSTRVGISGLRRKDLLCDVAVAVHQKKSSVEQIM